MSEAVHVLGIAGNLTDEASRKQVKDPLVALRDWTYRLEGMPR
jgi:hypothetical protein